MQLASTTLIDEQLFTPLADLPSFRNQVTRGLWQGEPAYCKVYPEAEYWQTEMMVLTGCSKRSYVSIPDLYHGSRTELRTVMSAVPGHHLEQITADQVRQLATVLKLFHQEYCGRCLQRLDLLARLDRFRTNIVQAHCLDARERQVSEHSCRLLESELVPVGAETNDLVHGDFNLGNVLFDSTQQKFSFIDFERSFSGLGLLDVAKGAWRILHNNNDAIDLFLLAYYGRPPTAEERSHFLFAQMFEYLGAISYFAYEGHKNGYPYKEEAINQLAACLMQF